LITLIGGEVGRGIGMLVLYAVISVVRQIAEPRLVGKSIGLHPLLTLISFYVGIRAFDVWGVLIGPAAALLLRELFGRSEQEKI
ncbi:MAG: AI-2E family transporter, partial [Clostridia bacterium]|nr:AI-2E family transporter [Clostridia bacterium]